MDFIQNGIAGSESYSYKSSFCTAGSCVELKFSTLQLFDSKLGSDVNIELSVEQWHGFLDGLSSGNSNYHYQGIKVDNCPDGATIISKDDVSLKYTAEEWQAFISGVDKGELRVREG